MSLIKIWYEATQDIPVGGELLSTAKVPLQLRDILNGEISGNQDDRSDRETGKFKKGKGIRYSKAF